MLMRPQAKFELARQVQIDAAALGDVFTFCSGLYFRGKLRYAVHFSDPPLGTVGVQIITPSRGLVEPTFSVSPEVLAEFSNVPVDSGEPRFTEPLRDSASRLASTEDCEFVLLGSIATGKYVDTLLPIFGERLVFPEEFSGRGDMSRGALLLRSVKAHAELRYTQVLPIPKRTVKQTAR